MVDKLIRLNIIIEKLKYVKKGEGAYWFKSIYPGGGILSFCLYKNNFYFIGKKITWLDGALLVEMIGDDWDG